MSGFGNLVKFLVTAGLLGSSGAKAQTQATDTPALFSLDQNNLRGRQLDEAKQCYQATLSHAGATGCRVLHLNNEAHHRVLQETELDHDAFRILEETHAHKVKSRTQRKDKQGSYDVVETEGEDGETALYVWNDANSAFIRISKPGGNGKAPKRIIIQPCPDNNGDDNCHVELIIDESELAKIEKFEHTNMHNIATQSAQNQTAQFKYDQTTGRLLTTDLSVITATIAFDAASTASIGAANLVGRARSLVELFNKITKNSGIGHIQMALQSAYNTGVNADSDNYLALMDFRNTDRKGAHIAVLIGSGGCGRSFERCAAASDDGLNSCPYSVVAYSCIDYSFAHEVGHQLGADHNDPYQTQISEADARGIVQPPGGGYANTGAIRTTMSYSLVDEERVLYYSMGSDAPAVHGTGQTVAYQIGSRNANNARVIASEVPVLIARLNKLMGQQQPTRRPTVAVPAPNPTRQPTTGFPTTSQPTTGYPTTVQATAYPTTSEPTTPEPTTAVPTTKTPTTAKPTKQPTTKTPTTLKPTQQPTTATPTFEVVCPDNFVPGNTFTQNTQLFATPTSANQHSFIFSVQPVGRGVPVIALRLNREFGGPIDLSIGGKDLYNWGVNHKFTAIAAGDTVEVQYASANRVIINLRNADGYVKNMYVYDSADFEFTGYANVAARNVASLNNVVCDSAGIGEEVTLMPTASPTITSMPTTHPTNSPSSHPTTAPTIDPDLWGMVSQKAQVVINLNIPYSNKKNTPSYRAQLFTDVADSVASNADALTAVVTYLHELLDTIPAAAVELGLTEQIISTDATVDNVAQQILLAAYRLEQLTDDQRASVLLHVAARDQVQGMSIASALLAAHYSNFPTLMSNYIAAPSRDALVKIWWQLAQAMRNSNALIAQNGRRLSTEQDSGNSYSATAGVVAGVAGLALTFGAAYYKSRQKDTLHDMYTPTTPFSSAECTWVDSNNSNKR